MSFGVMCVVSRISHLALLVSIITVIPEHPNHTYIIYHAGLVISKPKKFPTFCNLSWAYILSGILPDTRTRQMSLSEKHKPDVICLANNLLKRWAKRRRPWLAPKTVLSTSIPSFSVVAPINSFFFYWLINHWSVEICAADGARLAH